MASLFDHVRAQNMRSCTSVEVSTEEEEHDGEEESERPTKPSTVTLLLTPYNELADGRFVEPDSGVIVAVNHYNLVCQNAHLTIGPHPVYRRWKAQQLQRPLPMP